MVLVQPLPPNNESYSDAQIVAAVLSGNPARFEQLVRRHANIAFRYAYGSTHDWEASEDICQDAFLDSFRRMHQLRDPSRYRQWLISIIRNRCLSHARRHAHHVELLDEYDFPDYRGVDPTAILATESLVSAVRHLFTHLTESERVVATRYYVNGWTRNEIANELQIEARIVDDRLYKARRRLSQLLERAGVDGTCDAIVAMVNDNAIKERIMDKIRLELSQQLIPMVTEKTGTSNLIDSISSLRRQLSATLGAELPKVHVVDNLDLAKHSFRVLVDEHVVGTGVVATPEERKSILNALQSALSS